ncbi:hypothetical protein H8959_022836 [Pygathrix nigripes]
MGGEKGHWHVWRPIHSKILSVTSQGSGRNTTGQAGVRRRTWGQAADLQLLSPRHGRTEGGASLDPAPAEARGPAPPARVSPFLRRWRRRWLRPHGCGLPRRSSGREDEGRGRLPGGALRLRREGPRRPRNSPRATDFSIPPSTLWASRKRQALPRGVPGPDPGLRGAANGRRARVPRPPGAPPRPTPWGARWPPSRSSLAAGDRPLGRTHKGCKGTETPRRHRLPYRGSASSPSPHAE